VSSCHCRSGDPPQAAALAATDQVDGLGQGAPAPLAASARVRAMAKVAARQREGEGEGRGGELWTGGCRLVMAAGSVRCRLALGRRSLVAS
jgi:hypothetical protein